MCVCSSIGTRIFPAFQSPCSTQICSGLVGDMHDRLDLVQAVDVKEMWVYEILAEKFMLCLVCFVRASCSCLLRSLC